MTSVLAQHNLPESIQTSGRVVLVRSPKLTWPGDHGHSLQSHHVYQTVNISTNQINLYHKWQIQQATNP